MHIAVDSDDVLVDFVGGLLGVIKKEYDVEIPREHITQWDLHPILDPVIGGHAGTPCSQACTGHSFWKLLRDREWLWPTFPAIDGAIGHIARLRAEGHYMELVTSKPVWAEYNMYRWLGKWRPAFHRVTIVGLGDRKVDFTDADVLIDDKPQNCMDFLGAGRKAILFDSPHNKNFDNTSVNLERAIHWRHAYLVVKGMQKDIDGRFPAIP